MATSLSLTRDNIISAALRRIGVLGQGESASTNEVDEAATMLNAIIKEFDANSLFKWFIKSTEATQVTTDGVSSYTLQADVKWVEAVTYLFGGFEYPMEQITVGEYANIQHKTRKGMPAYYFVSTDLDTPVIHVYPVPYEMGTLKYWYRRKVDLFDNASDTLDLPEEWSRAIILSLAADLANEYGKPLDERSFHYQMAQESILRATTTQAVQLTGQEVTKPSPLLNNPKNPIKMERIGTSNGS